MGVASRHTLKTVPLERSLHVDVEQALHDKELFVVWVSKVWIHGHISAGHAREA